MDRCAKYAKEEEKEKEKNATILAIYHETLLATMYGVPFVSKLLKITVMFKIVVYL